MATKFVRSLSQRFMKSKGERAQQQPPPAIEARQICDLPSRHWQCRVQLPDQTQLDLIIPKCAVGQLLYDQVFAHLDLLEERDYFGLQFADHFQVQHWLDPAKSVRKQVPNGPPYTFRFRVKFFPNEPTKLRDELTRYLFFLQLKQDIQTGRLECPRDMAVQLAALALQSEFGDFNALDHSARFVSEFRFYPSQEAQMEADISRRHYDYRGMAPSEAEMSYLEFARNLDLYGVDMHAVEGKDGNLYTLGLSPRGMLVFDGRQKIGLFLWEKIQRLDFQGRKLILVVEEDLVQTFQEKEMNTSDPGSLIQLHTFVFQLGSTRACKHLWKCAIEFHTFFRLKSRRVQRQHRFPQLFRLGSTFRYRGRTEYETVNSGSGTGEGQSNADQDLNRQRLFSRRPSRRYPPRAPSNIAEGQPSAQGSKFPPQNSIIPSSLPVTDARRKFVLTNAIPNNQQKMGRGATHITVGVNESNNRGVEQQQQGRTRVKATEL